MFLEGGETEAEGAVGIAPGCFVKFDSLATNKCKQYTSTQN